MFAAQALLAAYLKFQATPEFTRWLDGPFLTLVCRVNETEFKMAEEVEDQVVLAGSGLDDREVALAFKPRPEYPKFFKFLRLYR